MAWQSYATLLPVFHNKVKTSYAMFWLKEKSIPHDLGRGLNLDRACGGKKPLEPGVDYTVKVDCFYSQREYRTVLGENTLSDQSMRFASIDGHVIKKATRRSRDFALVLGRAQQLSNDCPIDHVRLTAERSRFFLRRFGSANWPGFDGFTRSCFQVLQFNKLYLSSASARGRYCPGLQEVRPWGAVKKRRLVIIWTDLCLEGSCGTGNVETMQIDCLVATNGLVSYFVFVVLRNVFVNLGFCSPEADNSPI